MLSQRNRSTVDYLYFCHSGWKRDVTQKLLFRSVWLSGTVKSGLGRASLRGSSEVLEAKVQVGGSGLAYTRKSKAEISM